MLQPERGQAAADPFPQVQPVEWGWARISNGSHAHTQRTVDLCMYTRNGVWPHRSTQTENTQHSHKYQTMLKASSWSSLWLIRMKVC